MTIFLCQACGTSYPDAPSPPPHCRVCEDERQYIPAGGQAWIGSQALAAIRCNAWQLHEPGLFSLQTTPAFAIGQRAFLLRTPQGNVLWDCIALLDPATKALIASLGGLLGIAISHPHYYTTMQDWAEAFAAPIHLHEADRDWIMRPHPAIRLWQADTLQIADGVTLIRAGGHFAGGTVLHWAGAPDGHGVLLSGDIVQVAPGGQRVSFLWSYPNMMPLPATEIRRIQARLSPWRYDRVYGAFAGREALRQGSEIVQRSAQRYVELLEQGAAPE